MAHVRIAFLLAVTVAALLAFGAGTGSAAPKPAVFLDPAGDAGPGPDIAMVTVSVDDAGLITFQIEMPNRPTLGPQHETHIYVDSDQNSATGWSGGAELVLWGDATGVGLNRWNGTDFVDPTQPGSLSFAYADGAATFTIGRGDLPSSASPLRFWVATTDNFADPTNIDAAPEVGLFSFRFAEAIAIDSVVVPTTSLAPRAGRVVSARGVRLRLATEEIVPPDDLTCSLKVAGKVLAPLAGGCKWRIPASAAGKNGTLTITVSLGAETMTKRFQVRVRR